MVKHRVSDECFIRLMCRLLYSLPQYQNRWVKFASQGICMEIQVVIIRSGWILQVLRRDASLFQRKCNS